MSDKPVLLKAVEVILAKPESIKAEALAILKKYEASHPNESQQKAAEKLISTYSYMAAFSGGATSLSGVIPGIGTAVAMFGGATADAALCMKYQIEMTMAISTIYGHDILLEEENRLCMVIAGLGVASEFAKKTGGEFATKTFTKLVKENLKGPILQVIKEIFKKLGITFTRKALEKAIPFGVGVVVSFGTNKVMTKYVGSKAIDFFKAN